MSLRDGFEIMGLETLLGNEQLKKDLSGSIRKGSISHCYLISGPEGSGKHTLARLIAAAALCRGAEKPCGTCPSCRKLREGNHPDFITVEDPEHKNVAVKLIREYRADVFVMPNESERKVYLFPQEMGIEGQNALLKVLEEPPAYALFLILTDNAEKLLPTVRSRCVELRLEPVPERQALQWLQARYPQRPMADLQAVCRRSGGYLGQAASLLEGELTLPQTVEFAAAFSRSDVYRLTCLLCSMEKQPRDKLSEILAQWHDLLADALLARSGVAVGRQAAELGSLRTARALMEAASVVRKAMEYCGANVGAGHICGWLAVALRVQN